MDGWQPLGIAWHFEPGLRLNSQWIIELWVLFLSAEWRRVGFEDWPLHLEAVTLVMTNPRPLSVTCEAALPLRGCVRISEMNPRQ